MPVHNNDIAESLDKIADLLELQDKNEFRVRAYRNAARTVRNLSKNVKDMIDSGEDLAELSGIGEDLAGKIETLSEGKTLPLLEDLEKEMPEGLRKLMEIEGLGPKKVKKLHEELDIDSMDELKDALDNDEIRDVEGFGKKTEENIEENIERAEERESERTRLNIAEQYAESLVDYLANTNGVKHIDIAGSYRRRRATVGDVDILVSVERGTEIMDKFTKYDEVDSIISKGDKKSTIILSSGLQVDLRRVHEVNYGAALMYFTGSKEHNVGLRKIAQDNDWKLNEYGLFDGDDRIAGKSEKEVYDKLGLIYIPPELRENRGEIDAAKDGKLPDLVTMDNIKGELHAHTKATDGKNTIREMADAARDRGYSYIAITEHSKEVHVAGGLGADELRKHTDEIDEINEDYHNFKIMKGVEVDILESGELDLPDDVLKRLDYVLAAVHYNFDMPEEKMTRRMLKAMDNKHVNAIAHPFGKKINEREPYPMDFDKILEKAKERGIFLEMNGNPQRFDLDDVHCKAAKEAGVKIAIGTDSHSTQDLDFMRNSVAYARRGWLEKSDVVNTRTWTELKKLL